MHMNTLKGQSHQLTFPQTLSPNYRLKVKLAVFDQNHESELETHSLLISISCHSSIAKLLSTIERTYTAKSKSSQPQTTSVKATQIFVDQEFEVVSRQEPVSNFFSDMQTVHVTAVRKQ